MHEHQAYSESKILLRRDIFFGAEVIDVRSTVLEAFVLFTGI